MSRQQHASLRVASRDWLDLDGAEWREIMSGNDWLRAALPYQDEPLRFSGASLVHAKSSSAELGDPSSPLVLAVFGRLRQRPPVNKTVTHPR